MLYLECGKLIFFIVVFKDLNVFVVFNIVLWILGCIFLFKYFFGKVIFMFLMLLVKFVVKLGIEMFVEVLFFLL